MCFTVNYVMGTGFLTLPWAFNSAGILLALTTLTTVGVISDVSKGYILEAMARAELCSNNDADNIETALVPDKPKPTTDARPMVYTRKFEIIELCETFLGLKGKVAYSLTFSFYMYGCLWAYTAVFANAMAATINLPESWGLGDWDYGVWVAVFACITVPLTCMELREQVGVQVALSGCRFVMVLLMVATVLLAYNASTPQFDEQTSSNTSTLVDFKGFYKILPIAVYANIFHHSIPGLSAPVGSKEKLSSIFRYVFAFMFVAYGLIGVTVAWYFGPDIDSSANLNWHDYRAGSGTCTDHCEPSDGEDKVWSGRAWYVESVVFFVVLFPALDVASAFPLNGITLGNSLMGSYYGLKVREHEGNRATVTNFRVLAAVPPILGALVVRDLGKITDYTGITGFAIAFIFPALLHMKSKRMCKRRGLTTGTLYSGAFSEGEFAPWAMAAFGAFLVVFVLGCLVYDTA